MQKINVLRDFFNHKSDACPLECEEQERLEDEFESWFNDQMDNFEFASRFMMCHLGNPKMYHPHYTVITTNSTSEVMEGRKSVGHISDYVPD